MLRIYQGSGLTPGGGGEFRVQIFADGVPGQSQIKVDISLPPCNLDVKGNNPSAVQVVQTSSTPVGVTATATLTASVITLNFSSDTFTFAEVRMSLLYDGE